MVNLKLNKKGTIKNKNAGITLIALVVTIIVLLILAGVAISMALNDGNLFDKANEAKTSWNAKVEEENGINDTLAYIEQYIDGEGGGLPEGDRWEYNHATQTVKKSSKTLHIGEYVKYNIPDGQYYNGKWGVLGADKDGNLLLVSSKNIVSSCDLRNIFSYSESTGESQGTFTDSGKAILDSQVSSYLNTEDANYIRSINVEDINTVTGYDPEHEGYNKYTNTSNLGIPYSATGVDRYKNSVTYTLDKYNGMYYQGTTAYTNRQSDKNTKDFRLPGQASGSNTSPYTVESTGYKYYPDTLKDSSEGTTTGISKTESEDDKYAVMPYNLLFTDGSGNMQTYWLATPYVQASYGNVLWGYFVVTSGRIFNYDIWNSRAGRVISATRRHSSSSFYKTYSEY